MSEGPEIELGEIVIVGFNLVHPCAWEVVLRNVARNITVKAMVIRFITILV